MGKVVVLFLIALGVNAYEQELADILRERSANEIDASNQGEYEDDAALADLLRERSANQVNDYLPADLDDATHGKGKAGTKTAPVKKKAPVRASKPAPKRAPARAPPKKVATRPAARPVARKVGGIKSMSTTPKNTGKNKVTFRDFFTRTDQEFYQDPFSVATGGAGDFGTGGTNWQPKVGTRGTASKRIFGGTTKMLAGAGKPAQADSPSMTFWGGKKDPKQFDTGFLDLGKDKKGKRRALPVMPSKVQPMPRFGGALPAARPLVGARPFMLADLSTWTTLSNITFFVAAMSMISFALLLSRRRSSASEQEAYVSAP